MALGILDGLLHLGQDAEAGAGGDHPGWPERATCPTSHLADPGSPIAPRKSCRSPTLGRGYEGILQ